MHGGFGSALDSGFLMNDKDEERGKEEEEEEEEEEPRWTRASP